MTSPNAEKKLLVGDAYLVVARTNLDEIPLELCQTYHHAKMAVDAATEESIYKIAHDVMGVDCAGMCSVAIIVFLGGKPIDLEITRPWQHQDEVMENPPAASGIRKPKVKRTKKGKK